MKLGRPLKFTTQEELKAKISEYFAVCDAGRDIKVIDKRGDQQTHSQPVPYTMEGLAVYLNCDAGIIRSYGKRSEFSTTISQARDKIHNNWVEMGMMGLFNPKIVNLCLSASCPDYKQSSDVNVNVLSIEDKLRAIDAQNQKALPDPDVQDAEVVKHETLSEDE